MSEIKFDLAASAKKRRYNKKTNIDAHGVPLEMSIYAPASYNGKVWNIHDDEICLTISELGEYNDKGEWEDNPDCMNSADGMAWDSETPEEKAEAERQAKAFEDMLPPELCKAWE